MTGALAVPVANTSRWRAALTAGDRERHAHPALVLPRHRHGSAVVDHRIAGRPRRGVTVVADAEVDDVEPIRQRRGVSPPGGSEVAAQ